jgi:phosphatidylglycerol:prolipoprotein diacylglycerol transferase
MLVHPNFDPVALQLGPIAVRWYGLMYLLAFVLFVWLGKLRARRNLLTGWHPRDVDDMLFYGVFGVILGGRLGYVLFYKPMYYLAHPLEIVQVWAGGMSFHGGFSACWSRCGFSRARATSAGWMSPTSSAPLVPLGLAAGRLGNFINGELVGRATDVPWAMVFPQVDAVPRHPSQLYQFGLEGLLLFALLWWYAERPRPMGAVSGLFLIGYGSFRFIAEYAREPDNFLGFLAGGLTMGQWLSLPMVGGGILLMLMALPSCRQGATDDHGQAEMNVGARGDCVIAAARQSMRR